ncbi:hypothetical protein OK006_10764 [Actinobacteria bacterium OK006]|uniref:hypothetical protein n=1 Tax=unclassified Streptomyces TaxID=2593676 RepID=UPI0006CDE8CB|nr:hypothetical protein OK006_10764 [Actinobacteria bacterium OK006]
MMKTDAATVKQVTADWAQVFDGFDIWRPLRLLRRIGPLLQGITLDRSTSGDAYFPTAHIHALTRPFPVVSLTLGQRLASKSGMPEAIRFTDHAEDYLGAARRLAGQARLSLDVPPTVGDVVTELRAFAVAQHGMGSWPAVGEVEDSVLISSASGDGDLAEEGLQFARDLVKKWPKHRLPLDWVGEEVWITSLSKKADNAEDLRAIVESQVRAHKLAKVRQS